MPRPPGEYSKFQEEFSFRGGEWVWVYFFLGTRITGLPSISFDGFFPVR